MRSEIEQKIKNIGTLDDREIIEKFKEALRELGIPEKAIEKSAQNKDILQNLKHQVVLDKLNIRDEEIEEIAQMILEKKPDTVQISLSDNHITDKGAIKLARIFSSLNLFHLNLQDNQIGEEGFQALFELAACKPGLDLALGGNKLSEAGTVEKIRREAKRKYEGEKNLLSSSEDRDPQKRRIL